MKPMHEIGKKVLYVLIFTVVVSSLIGASWLVTCGIIKLIALCFGLSFKWPIATGIWLMIVLLKAIFKPDNDN